MATLMTWSITYLVHSTLLILLAAATARFIRSAPVRDVVWKVALTAGLATATLQNLIPQKSLPRIQQRETFSISEATIQSVVTPRAERASPPQKLSSSRAAALTTGPVQLPADSAAIETVRSMLPSLLLFGWVAGCVLLTTRLIAGAYRFQRLIADREELSEGSERRLLDELRASSGCKRAVSLTQSDAIHSPVAMIAWEIVIPKTLFARLSKEQQRSILAHELAHLMRRDPSWLIVTELLKAALLFQPLNWFAQRALKQTAEFICDDAAVQQTGDRRGLVETLTEIASVMTMRTPSNIAAMGENGSNFLARVGRVLRSGKPERPMTMSGRVALIASSVLLTVVFAPGVRPALSAGEEVADVLAQPAVIRRVAAAALEAVVSPASPSAGLRVSRAEPLTPANVTAAAVLPVRSTSAVSAVASVAEIAPVEETPATEPTQPTEKSYEARFDNGRLSRDFEGPDGKTSVELDARDVELRYDGSYLRFTTSRGYVRAHEQSARGPRRDVEVLPGRDGGIVRKYLVNGDQKAWCSDADRVIHAAFIKEKAYHGVEASSDTRSASEPRPGLSTWSGTHEVIRDADGNMSRIVIKANGVKFDSRTSRVYFEGGASVDVEEVSGNAKRTFTRDSRTTLYSGDFDGEEPAKWLVRMLTKYTGLDPAVARSISR